MITKLQVANFRGIRSMTLDALKDVNVFVGKNNCGKTSALEALFFWACVNRPDAAIILNHLRRLTSSASELLTLLFHNSQHESPIEISAEVNGVKTCIRAKTFISETKEVSISEGVNGQQLMSSPKMDGIKVFIIRNGGKEELCYSLTLQTNGEIGINRVPKQLDAPDLHYLAVHYKDDNSIGKIIAANREPEIVEALKPFAPNIRNIKIGGENKVVLVDEGRRISLPLELQGDGVVRATQIFSKILAADSGSIVLIDEIDNGMHASTLKTFWKTLVSLAQEKHVQIFATTHSWESLAMLKGALEENETLQNFVSVINFVRRAEDNINAYPYDYPSFRDAVESDIDIR
ncbi:MAG: AAA family ATPase [Puniceicoccales bacterium]|nr:AAA family ATPase [Puniceicoccales bacterium]